MAVFLYGLTEIDFQRDQGRFFFFCQYFTKENVFGAEQENWTDWTEKGSLTSFSSKEKTFLTLLVQSAGT